MKKLWPIIGILIVVILATVAILTQTKEEPKEIKIGAILPLTGNNARYGIWIQEALELAKDDINSKGGINGKKIKIIYEDDQVDPKLAANAMQKLATVDKVPVVFGSWASSSVLAQAPIAERTHIVIMAQAISPKIRFAGDYVFRCIPDANHSLSVLVPFAVMKGVRKAGIIYVNNDYGKDQADVFKKKLEVLGSEIVFQERYDLETTDFRTILSKVRESNVDAVYLPGYTEVGLILRQMKELDIHWQVYSSDPFENEDILKVARNAAEGVFYPSFFVTHGATEELKRFIDIYKSKYGREPESNAALAYNGIKIIFEAIRKVGTEPQAIKESLYQFKNYPSVLGIVNIDSYGDMTLPVYIKTVQDSAFVFVK